MSDILEPTNPPLRNQTARIIDVGTIWIVAQLPNTSIVKDIKPDFARSAKFKQRLSVTGISIFARCGDGETWLAKAAGELAFGIAAARLILRFGYAGDLVVAQKLGRKLLAVTDSIISGMSFLTDETMTIADLAIYSYAALSPEAGIPLDQFANVRRWIEAIEARPRFVPLRRLDTVEPPPTRPDQDGES